MSVRVLYSFPHKLGAGRITETAWQQIKETAEAGATIVACPTSIATPLPSAIETNPTLAIGRMRLPFRVFGSMRTFALHDRIIAARLRKDARQIDIVHLWPCGALETLKVARRMGIPTVLERPNAHTGFAYAAVKEECDRLNVALPSDHEHAYKSDVLAKEEAEYELADSLLCPSDFVKRTFLDRGFSEGRLKRHQYGFDAKKFSPPAGDRNGTGPGLSALFVGGCAPRKGLHYALEAWLRSSAHRNGQFLIAGEFVPGYRDRLLPMLEHPSVRALGHRTDVSELMRASDVLILPSIEEGSALVTYEARGSGCVLMVSSAAGAICTHMHDSLVHTVGDVEALSNQLTALSEDRELLLGLRRTSLRTVAQITWQSAGIRLLDIYRQVLDEKRKRSDDLTCRS